MIIFYMPVRKRIKKAEGSEISHYYWPFSSDIMAVKGLTSWIVSPEAVRVIVFILGLVQFFYKNGSKLLPT